MTNGCRAGALIEGRDKVIPEGVQAGLPGVAAHRLRAANDAAGGMGLGPALLAAVPIPCAFRPAHRPEHEPSR